VLILVTWAGVALHRLDLRCYRGLSSPGHSVGYSWFRPRGIPMSRRLLASAGAVAVVVAIVAVPATASRSCGSVSIQHNLAAIHVVVAHGPVRCQEARRVAKIYGNGGGVRHGTNSPSRSGMYSIVSGGWRCSSGAGGLVCSRGKQTGLYHREEVEGLD
jgi:hypothetical protein